MSGFGCFKRFTVSMNLSEQDILRIVTKSRDRIAAAAWVGSGRWAAWSWMLGTAACLALIANISFFLVNTEPKIVTITGVSGPVRWTGNGGRVFHDIRVGTKLSGGTVEGLTSGSWFELTLDDDSTVTLSGNSTLTFADHGQKTLHLGPEGTHGKWSAKTAVEEAKLETIPSTTPQGLTIYMAALGVSQGDMPPVILPPGCRLRVRGHMVSSHDAYFGVTVRYLSGGFAGRC